MIDKVDEWSDLGEIKMTAKLEERNPIENWKFGDENDKLQRKHIADKFTNIIVSNNFITENDGFVVALDSAWGTGKTSFIHMWRNILIDGRANELNTVYYNAWENDDYEHALIPIMAEIYKENKQLIKDIPKLIGKAIFTLSGVITRQLINHHTGLDTKEIAIELENSISNSITEDYENHIKDKRAFRKELLNLTKNKKVIVFIDELDRCRPTFAIETLEAIKHFLNIKDLIFVFAVDMTQLSHSIATMYGQNMDASGYLARFFDLQLRFPGDNYHDYISSNAKKFNLPDVINPLMILPSIAKYLDLSIRDLRNIINNISLFFELYEESIMQKYDTIIEVYNIYSFLIALKYKEPDILNTILHQVFIKVNNSTNVTTVILDNRYYNIHPDINKFLTSLETGKNIRSLLDACKNNPSFIIDDDINEEPLYRYIERKLEFLDFIEQE